MTPSDVLDLFRDGLLLVVIMVTLIVVPSLLVGLVVSVFQAATQINEQTLSFLPRLLTTLLTIVVAGPWLLSQLMDFTERLIRGIPQIVG
ncbi:MAG: flagellar biosynthesis protein FliQ [Gammaproteobacteria bacterium]|nr:flagellar biosynthesis protein FliQ [Gammaproteobacteria bacterium]